MPEQYERRSEPTFSRREIEDAMTEADIPGEYFPLVCGALDRKKQQDVIDRMSAEGVMPPELAEEHQITEQE